YPFALLTYTKLVLTTTAVTSIETTPDFSSSTSSSALSPTLSSASTSSASVSSLTTSVDTPSTDGDILGTLFYNTDVVTTANDASSHKTIELHPTPATTGTATTSLYSQTPLTSASQRTTSYQNSSSSPVNTSNPAMGLTTPSAHKQTSSGSTESPATVTQTVTSLTTSSAHTQTTSDTTDSLTIRTLSAVTNAVTGTAKTTSPATDATTSLATTSSETTEITPTSVSQLSVTPHSSAPSTTTETTTATTLTTALVNSTTTVTSSHASTVTAKDPCANNPCLYGGTCSNNQGIASCACPPSRTGSTCEFNFNPCSPNPCQNGGTCTDQAGIASCSCAPFYTDSTCSTNNDPCGNTPCRNGGTCAANSAAASGFTCTCPDLNDGDNCENFIHEPPTCSEQNVTVAFDENTTAGTFSQVSVNCSTRDGHSLLLNVSSVSDGPFEGFVSDGNPDTDHMLQFKINVTDNLLYRVGNFEVMLLVYNELGQTAVTWNVTVDDVNQRPSFLRDTYDYTVAENTAVGQRIAEVDVLVMETQPQDQGTSSLNLGPIIVWDPDNFTDSYKFQRVLLTGYLSDGPTNSVQPIQLVDSPYGFEVTSTLQPGITHTFWLQAEDGEPLTDITLVRFTILDVNDPPSCQVTSASLDLVTPVGTPVYTLSCSDQDVNETFAALTYAEYDILDSDYFSVNQSGVVSLDKQLTIDDDTLTYSVYVTDGGGLSVDVNITFNVSRDYPPQCSPQNLSLVIPEDATTTECATASLSCSHDSALDKYNLTIDILPTSPALFNVSYTTTSSVLAKADFVLSVCPLTSLLGNYGLYDWTIEVANVLSSTVYPGNITVQDINQPPQFSQAQYQVELSEMTPSGSTVAKVTCAVAPGPTTVPAICVSDVDSDSQYTLHKVTVIGVVTAYPNSTNVMAPSQSDVPIQLSANDEFVVQSALGAGLQYVFTLQAIDAGGLTDNTVVTFTVRDENSAPICQNETSVPLDLQHPPTSPVYNLSCTDVDVNVTLSTLTYQENHILDFGNYPPSCSPSLASLAFLETDSVGTCSSVVVECTGPTGRNLKPAFSIISDATSGEIIISESVPQSRTSLPGNLLLKACVDVSNGRALTIGEFTIDVNVSYILGSTDVEWNITVTDVNAAPQFEYPTYNTTVAENVTVGTTVAVVRNQNDAVSNFTGDVIVMSDPDTVTDNFKIKSLIYTVRAEYTDGTPFEDTFETTTKPLELLDGSFVIFVRTALRPDLIYIVGLTAADGEGLTANTTLFVNVDDVNEPPSCSAVPNVNLALVTSVSTTVLTVSCTDSDFNDTFKSLTYAAHAQGNYTFFNVSESGDIILAKPVPRDALTLTLPVYAVDGGGLTSDVTVTFTIFRDYPPSCNPTISPPSVWRKDECFRLIPNCQDPSTPQGDNSFIDYNLTGDFISAFRENMSLAANDFAEYCYLLTTDGSYSIQLTADNGLGTYVWDYTLTVTYLSAQPRFDYNQYQQDVQEDTPVGSTVESVRATVNNREVPLQYSLQGSSDFSQYFTIDASTGSVTVLISLFSAVSTTLQTQVWATDPDTGLKSSVLISIDIEDVNQPPQCDLSFVNVTVPWNVAQGQSVAMVNCTDSDPTTAFSTLTYDILAAGNEDGAWRVRLWTGDVYLVSRDRLSPDIVRYQLTVQASDSSFHDDANVTININRTVPLPTVQTPAIGSSSVTVSWSVNTDYAAVINGYSLVLSSSTGAEQQTVDVGKDVTSYDVTGLQPEQSYSVTVTVKGKGGDVTSDSVTFTTQAVAVLMKVSAEFRMQNVTWTDDLLDNQSSTFFELRGSVENAVDGFLKTSIGEGYVETYARSFRAGSVYADLVITINQKTTTSQLERELLTGQVRGKIGGLPVDTNYSLKFHASEVYITDMTVTLQATRMITSLDLIVEGTDVTVTCHARTPGISNPSFQWALNGVVVTSSSSERLQVSSIVRDTDDPYGTVRCTVSGTGQYSSTTKYGEKGITVVSKVRATLSPRSIVVPPGRDVSLTCTRSAGYQVDWQTDWYKIGANNARTQVASSNKSDSDNSATYVASNVQENAIFQCDVIDSQGVGSSGYANVIILQQEELQCPADGLWPNTPAGVTFPAQCPMGYDQTGEMSRKCRTDGQWEPADTSGCVREELNTLSNTVNEIQAGQSTNRTGEVVERLANATQGDLLQGDLQKAVDILDKVSNISSSQPPDNDTLKNFVQSADNLLQAPADVWQNRTPDAFTLVEAVDMMGEAASRSLNDSQGSMQLEPISTDKIVLQIGQSRNDIVFPIRSKPEDYPAWVIAADNSAFLSKDAFPGSVNSVKYCAVMYRNLTNVFSGQLDNSLHEVKSSELFVNSPILTLSIANVQDTIRQPVQLTFEHISENFSTASCQFLDYSTNSRGAWSTRGCKVVTSNRTTTQCSCDHLTNFAVLMSPYRPGATHTEVLSIITIVGCSISIFCLLVTIIVYIGLWRYVKSDRSVVLVNLCVVLLLAYITFLAGVNRTEVEIACKVVSALLHYLFLVVFFLMLCEGLDIFISVVIVFPIKSVLIWLLLMAYVLPAVIVGVSLGIRLDGYGGPDFCWLSLEDGLLWAFVGPALAALLANFVFVALVIKALMSSTHLLTKSQRDRAKSILKAICVMTPILGLTWVFGVFSVNEETVAFQYLFLIFNTLQGFLIFLFHCLLSKQVREGFKNKKRRYEARLSADPNSKYISQKQTSESSVSNDLDKTTSPFLQVDRQVQQMAAKVNRLEGHNIAVDEPPKEVAVKDPVPVATTSSMAPPLNVRSDNQGRENTGSADVTVLRDRRELTIEAGNLMMMPPSMSLTGNGVEGRQPQKLQQFPVKKMASLEDNAQQEVRDGRRYSKKSDGSGSRGSANSSNRPKELNSRDKKIQQKSAANRVPTTQEEERQRLDHVYGAGARISDSSDFVDRPQKKNIPRGRPSQSSEDVSSFSTHKNPVYSDVAPALSPTDRWVTSTQPSNVHRPVQRQYPLDSRQGPSHPSPGPLQQAQPSSPRRLAASAESLGKPAVFHPFSGMPPRAVDTRHSNKRPPPRVAPKPRGRGGWNEPPVDYW
ncbi:hypothetical protein BaRGS_00017228, partial [Batillaria attramentaria]